jgi:hypothetical protein
MLRLCRKKPLDGFLEGLMVCNFSSFNRISIEPLGLESLARDLRFAASKHILIMDIDGHPYELFLLAG